MFICNCNGVREREILEIALDATTPRQVFSRLGCEAQCCRCVPEIAQILRETKEAARQQKIGAARMQERVDERSVANY